MALRLETIGPYRIEGRLGAGGMGEVYRAWDSRLERRVAIKLIRPEAAGSERARERFRREARAAAGLSHPAIVQIFDILETPDGDAIVMELVEGETLARRLDGGPLGRREAVRVGRDIAEGLAAAHAKGLLHRDLKPENVVLTNGGHAKILDFGLAKRLEGEDPLTRDSMVVGTFRCMSPEQARGLPLDARSDLFSFGTLLYEMISGRSPFESPTTLETLTRVCTLRQEPLRSLDPAIPEPLARLVDHLLEKDPARRPGSAREVAEILDSLATGSTATLAGSADAATWIDLPGSLPGVKASSLTPAPLPAEPAPARGPLARNRRWLIPLAIALLILAGVATLWRPTPAGAGTVSVAVTRPEIARGAGNDRTDLLAAGLRGSLLRGLLSVSGVSPLAPELVDPVAGSPVQVARAVAADEVLTSRLDCGAEACQVTLSRVHEHDGRLLWTRSFEAAIDRPHLLAEAVQGYLQEAYPGRDARPGLSELEVGAEPYQEYLRVRREVDRKEKGLSLDVLLDRAAAIQRRSPRFLEAYVLEAEILRQRFGAGRNPADLDRAMEVLADARRLAPDDPRPLQASFEIALKGEHLEAAEEALAELGRVEPGDPLVIALRARLVERRGDHQKALELMREAVRLRPSWNHLSQLANMEYRLGESAAARRHLEELLRRYPGYHSGWSLLAQIELLAGDPQRALEIYGKLVERSPGVTEINNLGTAFLLLKRYPEAEARFREALRLEPRNPFVTLNLADVLLLAGRKAEAEAAYRHLLELASTDPAAGSWQILSTRAQALAHLGDRRAAVEAAQQVLVLAQGNAQAAFEAALVYALVDDRSSAVVTADRALAQGVEARWFDLPWFDALRASPEWRGLLKTPR
ncbi:MAG: protein kinase domain-containing protein [Thermoanaerobaculia bacterium]